MYQLIIEKLNLKNYDFNSKVHNDFAQEIYIKLLSEEFSEVTFLFPTSFSDFKIDLQKDFSKNSLHFNKLNFNIENQFNTASHLIEIMDDIIKSIIENQENILLIFRFFLFQKVQFLASFSFINKRLIFSYDEVISFLDKKIYFSQSFIAEEWEVDNDTLSKWFVIEYGINKYKGRKKIKLSEYISIFKDLFILEEHKKNPISKFTVPDEQMDLYNSLALKGKTYLKKDILEECFNPDTILSTRQYDQAKLILEKKFPYYNDLNKFPTSIAFKLIAELKKYC